VSARGEGRGIWKVLGILAVVLALSAGLFVRARSQPSEPPKYCDSSYVGQADEVDEADRYSEPESQPPAGANSVVQIGPWDSNIVWKFRSEETFYRSPKPPSVSIVEGVFRSHQAVDVTKTDIGTMLGSYRRSRHREVVIGQDRWAEDASPSFRTHCTLVPGGLPRTPMRVNVGVDRPRQEGTIPPDAPLDALVNFTKGTRLPVGPGTPTKVDGDSGTAYVWFEPDKPWLLVEFTLDERQQLRAVKVSDTEHNVVYYTMTARPAPEALIADPSDQPIVSMP
jgi:hypothetical protein